MENKNMILQDTRELQQAIEKIIDEETAVLPPIQQLSNAITPDSAQTAQQAQTTPPTYQTTPENTSGVPQKASVSSWFFTLMCMNIPIVGWIYLIYLALNKKRTDRQNFARAYLFYKLLFLLISLAILIVIFLISMNILDRLLAYMEML